MVTAIRLSCQPKPRYSWLAIENGREIYVHMCVHIAKRYQLFLYDLWRKRPIKSMRARVCADQNRTAWTAMEFQLNIFNCPSTPIDSLLWLPVFHMWRLLDKNHFEILYANWTECETTATVHVLVYGKCILDAQWTKGNDTAQLIKSSASSSLSSIERKCNKNRNMFLY